MAFYFYFYPYSSFNNFFFSNSSINDIQRNFYNNLLNTLILIKTSDKLNNKDFIK